MSEPSDTGVRPETIFVSYARKDLSFVEKLEADLHAAGIDTWRDQRRLVPGQPWVAGVAHAVQRCRGVIVVLSSQAVGSPHVKQEVHFAWGQGKLLLPVVHEEVELPPDLDFILGGLERVDLTRENYARGVTRLADTLGEGAGRDVAPPSDRATDRPDHAVYFEDAASLLENVSRGLLWRVLSLRGEPFSGRVLAVIFLRPWSIVGFWLFSYGVMLAILMVWTVAGLSLSQVLRPTAIGIMLVTAAVMAAVPTLGWIAARPPLKRLRSHYLADGFSWLPRRPLNHSLNPLLDHLDRVEPVLEELLGQPVDSWDAYVTRRCPDPELAGRVWATLFILERV